MFPRSTRLFSISSSFLTSWKCKPGGRFIQDVKRSSRGAPAQLLRKLDPLGFAARKSSRRLAELDISKPDIIQRLQFLRDRGYVFHQRIRIADIHFEQVGDGIAFVLHGEGFPVIALSLARFAQDMNIGQKTHFDAAQSIPLAVFAAPAFDIETESSGLIAADAGLGKHRKKLSEWGEKPGVGGRIGTGSPADRRLIDFNHLIQVLDSEDLAVQAGIGQSPMQLA